MDWFFDDLTLNACGTTSLREQLLFALRIRILDGRLHAGAKMPPTRTLAQLLGVSRNTVVHVYDTLLSDGMIVGQHGRGTFVSKLAAHSANAKERPSIAPSVRARILLKSGVDWSPSRPDRVFEPGVPALDRFPRERWRRSVSTAIAGSPPSAFGGGDTQGSEALRGLIAAHIGPSRGVGCTADRIVLFSSQRLALHVLMTLLLEPGGPVLIENPCLPEILGVVRVQGQQPVPLPVLNAGADIRQMNPSLPRASRLAIVTPSHQYPTGTAMEILQRRALLNWASEENAYVLEDDYDGEFWLSDNRQGTLFSQATDHRVIYFNSFSKTLFPSLRISYLVLPKELVAPITALKSIIEPMVSTMAEMALTEFIASGAYTAHLREMRQTYRERHNVLRYALGKDLGDKIHIAPRQYGLHLCVDLDPRYPDHEIAAAMHARNYGCKALSSYYFAPADSPGNGLVMGYAGWNGPDLIRGVAELRTICG